MDQAKKPTMKDLAREAGVSLGTVSKVINGLPVGEEYRLRVEEAIAKLDYRINTFAKGLRSGKTMMVALILPNLTSPFFSWLANSIGNELASRKYRMLLFCTNDAPEQEQECVRLAEQQKVDGVICLSFRSDLAVPEGVRFISVDRSLRPEIPCVSSDNYAGGWLAAQKLAEFGCTRPAMLCIGSAVPNEPAKRRDGFAAGCAALGLPCEIKSLSDGATPVRASRTSSQSIITTEAWISTVSSASRIPWRTRRWLPSGGWGCGCPKTCRSSASTAAGTSATWI